MSVCGTVKLHLKLRDFSWKLGISDFEFALSHSALGVNVCTFIRMQTAYGLRPGHPAPGSLSLLRPLLFQRLFGCAGILTCFPSPTPFGLGLGSG